MAKKKRGSKKSSGAKNDAPKKEAAPKRGPASAGSSEGAPSGDGGRQGVASAFTEVVTRLRDTYLASVPKDARRKHARHIQMMLPPAQLEEEINNEEAELARRFQALPLGVVQHGWFFLHPEGRVLLFNLLQDEVTAEYSEAHSLDYGLRIGSKRFPELEALISPRPTGATECRVCAGKGRSDRDEKPFTCEHCWGRGWYPPGLYELIDRTSAALHNGSDYDTTVVTVRTFLADGAAQGFSASMLCAAFETALQIAGFDKEQRGLRHGLCGSLAKESFPNGWPF